jgi:hypothetical protein
MTTVIHDLRRLLVTAIDEWTENKVLHDGAVAFYTTEPTYTPKTEIANLLRSNRP